MTPFGHLRDDPIRTGKCLVNVLNNGGCICQGLDFGIRELNTLLLNLALDDIVTTCFESFFE